MIHNPLAYRASRRSVVMAPYGIVATSQPLAAQAGIDILKAGGNAIDAAIAVNAVLGVVEPMSCGIGGDLFAIIWDAASNRLHGLNASGRAPYAATIDLFEEKGCEYIPDQGPLSWSVPGCVDGWECLRQKFGTLDYNQILAPAIDYAVHGYPVSDIIALDWAGAENLLTSCSESLNAYLPGGHAPRAGEIFKNHDLADVYRSIVAGGRDAFYLGETAERIKISSTKSQLGHLLGAAGGVEAIATVLAMQHGVVPATLNYENPDPECDLDYTPDTTELPIRVALSNSFGFGGQNACLLFHSIEGN